jgi:hypothetical protein
MGHELTTYIPGDWWEECPVCGFDVRRNEMVVNYAGVRVCKKDLDPPPRRWKYTGRPDQRPPSKEG